MIEDLIPWAYREFGSKGILVKFEYIFCTEKLALSIGISLYPREVPNTPSIFNCQLFGQNPHLVCTLAW